MESSLVVAQLKSVEQALRERVQVRFDGETWVIIQNVRLIAQVETLLCGNKAVICDFVEVVAAVPQVQ